MDEIKLEVDNVRETISPEKAFVTEIKVEPYIDTTDAAVYLPKSKCEDSEEVCKEETGGDRKIEFEGTVYMNGKRNRIKCPQCDTTFKNRSNLKNHLKFIHATEGEMVECKICFRTFKSLAHLRSHTASVHAEVNEVSCQHCNKTFLNKKKLNNHIFYTHPTPQENVVCNICSKEFRTTFRLKTHVRMVHPEGQSVNCSICSKEFKCDMLLQRHVKWAHPLDGMAYRCQDCGRVLPSILCFKKHMKNVHGMGNVSCDICDKSFQTKNTLRRHLKQVHEGFKSEKKDYKPGDLQCSQCDKKFSTNTALTWHHERLHSNNKVNTSCHICVKDFGDHNGLKRHMETVHSMETATCELCSKTFKSFLNLQRHIRITHAPPEAAQTCEICKKTFKCSMHLKIHVYAVHPKDGKVSCDVCQKEFSSKKYLLKHEKTHNKKEFPCNICGNYYKSINDVNRHMKRVHFKSDSGSSKNGCCLKCGLVFDDMLQLSLHVVSCGKEETNSLSIVKVEIEEV